MSELSITPQPDEVEDGEPRFDQVKLGQIMDELRAEQSVLMAVTAGLGASLVAAVIWALIAYFSGYTLGIVAVGVGFLVGYAVSFAGKGLDTVFGIIGASFALFGCLLGNLLTVAIFASQAEGVSLTMVIGAFLDSPGVILEVFQETFSLIDLLFYGIAIYEGYRLSFRRIKPEDLAGAQKLSPDAPPQPGQ